MREVVLWDTACNFNTTDDHFIFLISQLVHMQSAHLVSGS